MNFEMKQGSNFEVLITIKDADSVLIDITGYDFKSQARPKADSSEKIDFVFEILDQTTNKGQVKMKLAKEITNAITIPTRVQWVYDVEMTDTDDFTENLFGGNFVMIAGITR